MKRIFITVIAAIFLITGIAIAGQTYAPESLDNTVENRNQVEVKETDTSTVVKEKILTLMQIDLDLAALDARIQRYQDVITALEAVRVLVEVEANKVILNKP